EPAVEIPGPICTKYFVEVVQMPLDLYPRADGVFTFGNAHGGVPFVDFKLPLAGSIMDFAEPRKSGHAPDRGTPGFWNSSHSANLQDLIRNIVLKSRV